MTHMLVAAIVASSVFARSDDCAIAPNGFLKEPRVEFRGLYTNREYLFSVVIPDGLTGYEGADPPHHGFGLLLGEQQQSYLYVDGSVNSLEERDSRDAANRALRYLREGERVVESSTLKPSRLGELPATELVARYTCGRPSTQYMTASVFALSPNREMMYEITLYTARDHFSRARRVFDRMIRSWRYLGGVREYR